MMLQITSAIEQKTARNCTEKQSQPQLYQAEEDVNTTVLVFLVHC